MGRLADAVNGRSASLSAKLADRQAPPGEKNRARMQESDTAQRCGRREHPVWARLADAVNGRSASLSASLADRQATPGKKNRICLQESATAQRCGRREHPVWARPADAVNGRSASRSPGLRFLRVFLEGLTATACCVSSSEGLNRFALEGFLLTPSVSAWGTDGKTCRNLVQPKQGFFGSQKKSKTGVFGPECRSHGSFAMAAFQTMNLGRQVSDDLLRRVWEFADV